MIRDTPCQNQQPPQEHEPAMENGYHFCLRCGHSLTPEGEDAIEALSNPGLTAFSQRAIAAFAALDKALTREDITEAANACHWLVDEVEEIRNHLVILMVEREDR